MKFELWIMGHGLVIVEGDSLRRNGWNLELRRNHETIRTFNTRNLAYWGPYQEKQS